MKWRTKKGCVSFREEEEKNGNLELWHITLHRKGEMSILPLEFQIRRIGFVDWLKIECITQMWIWCI